MDAISKADGQSRVLHDGDALSEGMRVVTGPGANAILVFSNGASVDLAADSSLDIDQFEQDPFGSDEKVSDMKEEQGTSTTKLNLSKGELVGKVVHLNVDKGSEFTVQTPVGAAGIRGTIFRIVFRPGPDGKAIFTVTTAEGRVLFTGITSTPVSIPAGQKVVVTFDVNSGVATTPVVLTPISPTEAAQIQTATQNIISANSTTTFSAAATTPTGTAPPPPPAPLPSTTSSTGSTG